MPNYSFAHNNTHLHLAKFWDETPKYISLHLFILFCLINFEIFKKNWLCVNTSKYVKTDVLTRN